MLHLMLKNTLLVQTIKEDNDPLWQRFIENALEEKVGCVIDVGAILAGKSLKN